VKKSYSDSIESLENKEREMFKKILMVGTLAVVSACASVPTGVESYTVTPENSMGGELSSFANAVNQLNANGTEVIIKETECLSACTYFLLANNLKVNPETKFGFHSAKSWATTLTMVPIKSPKDNAVWARDLESKCEGLGDWFLEEGTVLAGYKFIKGQWFIDNCAVEAYVE
jgi:hypothetical protein